jgi:hypothetical protein
MANLKGILFSQFASEGFNLLVKEMQDKYKPKKGRRFHHDNITYEIGRPVLKEENIEFEISSKIPEDELNGNKEMKKYFDSIKKVLNQEKSKPLLVEMENIVWDSKKDTEKERDYVKLIYQYSLNDLFDDNELIKRFESSKKGEYDQSIPDVPGILTLQGKLVLMMVCETMQQLGKENISTLINANKQVKSSLKN